MITHIRVIGILHIVMGGLGLLAGVMFILFFGGLAGVVGLSDQTRDSLVAIPVLGTIGVIIFTILALLSLPSLIAGIGLLQFRPWARMLTIVLSVLHLFNIPFGTAMGVYGLWALLAPESEALFQRGAMTPAQTRY